jgi:hypothetical protein
MKGRFIAVWTLFAAGICLISFTGTFAVAQESGISIPSAVQPAPARPESQDGNLTRETGEAGDLRRGESSMTSRPMAWENPDQQARCEAYLPRLKQAYGQTRNYSMRGDPCSAARYGKVFMDLVDACQKECPKGFLEANGYSSRSISKANVHYEVGKKKCPEWAKGGSPAVTEQGSEPVKPAQPGPR